MIKKLTKFGRSTLSVILCLTMLLTTFCFFDIGSVISNAMVTVTENNKMKGSLSSQFMYAPEIAYLKPGSSAFQYFSNYDPATGKAISTNDATSRLEFDYKGATEIAIGVNRVYYKNGENDVDFSGTLKINNVTVTQNKVAYNATTSTSFSSIASSASGAISVTLNASQCSLTGAATGTTYYIQWVFRYKVDGAYHFAFMYTGVYVPLLDQAGTSTSQRYIKSGSNPTENHSWSFITGAMKYSGGNRKSQFLGTTANTLLAAPLVSFVGRAQNENNYTIPCGDGQALNENNFSSSQTPYNTFVYNRPKRGSNELYYDTTSISVPSSYSGTVAGNVSITNTGDGVIGSGITLGMAYIVVDTSRYTNYNQIPYLSAGYAQFYHDLDGNGNKLNSIKSVKRYNKGSSTSIAYDGTIYCDVDTSNYTDHDSYSVARGLYKFNGSVIDGLVTFDTWFYNGYKHFVGYTESIGVHHYNGLYTETVNKQTLRTVYNDASHSHIDYKTYSSGYSAYYTELKSVAETLCNPQLYSKTTTSLSGTASGSVKAIETSIINSTTTADNYVYFYVPEVIYLTPGKTTFQYYSDMSSVSLSNGVCTPTVNSANKDTTGNIYFYYKNASKVKITQSGASSVSLSGGNVTSFNSYVNTSQSAVTTANISGGSVSSAASTYITWTATYVEDNIEKTVTAKSYVYSPYTSAFSAAARYKCSDGTNHFCDSFAYLSGVHSITGMNDVNRYASATNLTPLLGRLKEPVNNTHMTPDGTWIDGSSTSNAYASRFSDDSGSSDRVVVAHAGTGKIYVDTSRFTDLNKIPNLTFGFGVTDRQNANELYYFVADYTGINTRGNGSTTSHFDEWNRTPNYVMWGNKNTKQTVSEGMKYNNGVVPGTNTLSTTDGTENKVIGTQVYTYQSGDRALNALYLHLDIVRANRSGLRKAVEYAAKYSYALQAEYFNGSTQWTNYTTALANAQNALTKVDGTANFGIFPEGNVAGSGLAKTLKDAVDVLLNANRGTAPRNTNNYTATQKNVGLVANSNGTFTVAAIAEAASDGTASISKTFKAYDKVEFSAEQYEGYKYVGYIKGGASSNGDAFSATDYNNMVNSTDPVSKSKNETLTFGNAKNVNYSYTFYYILNPDVLFDNEFDFDQWALKATFSGAYSFDMATNTATITNPGTSTDYSTSNINGTGSYYMNVLPNHTYRISMKVKMGSTAGTVDYMAFAFRDANRSNPSVGTSPYYSRPSISLAANAEGTLTSEFKIPSDASYMTLRLGLRTANITASFSDIYIQDITTPGGFKDDVTDATPHANLSLISGSQIGNVASISRTGYAFDGWYNNQDSTGNGTGTKYTSTSTVGNSNLRLYAKWTVAPELMFDNEFRFDNITASDIASGANNSTFDIDYGSNKLRLNAKGSDAYTGQWYGIKSGAFAVTPGHTYRIRTTVKNTSSSAKYAAVYIFCFADSNLNSTDTNGNRKSAGVTVASGAESTIDFNYTVQTGRYYGALRFGINDSANGDTAEFSNIYVQDTTSPGGVADDVTPADPINKVKLSGETVGSLADIERSGYTFTGWNTAKNGTGTTYTESTKMPSSNTQLWSQWDVNSYTITFAPNGGSVTPTSKTFTINDSISLPTPTRTGYTFSGWKVTEKADVSNWTLNDVYTGTSIPAGKYGNVTLTAQWTVNTYTITYKYNNGAADTTAKYTIEQSITLPSPSKTGYTFAGWKVTTAGGNWNTTDSVYKGTVAAGKYGNVTLTAQWTVNTYTITYKYNNGAADTTAKYTIEQSITLPSPTKTGYTFAGWKVTTAGGNWKTTDSVYKGTVAAGKYGNVTLTAQWTANTYTITYVYNNGSANTTATYNIEQAITLPSPTKTGYTFAGWKVTTAGGNWNTTDSVYKGTVAAGKYGNVTLTAQWTVNTYTITYKYNNGAADTTAKYTIEQSITLPSPTKTGYTFAGWKVTTAGGNWNTTDSVYKGTVAAGKYGNVTLTAQWTVNTYTITYKYNNGAADTTAKYTIEQSITLPSPSKTGYTFAGWKVTTAGGNWKTTDSVYKGTVAAGKYGNVTLTAQWTANTYTITYVYNNGSANTTATYNIEQAITLPSPTKTGYTFAGWKVTTAGGNWKTTDSVYKGTVAAGKYGNVTLTAQWTVNTYTITYKYNNGAADTTAKYTIEQSITLPSPSKTGYTFAGWKVTTAGGNWKTTDSVYKGTVAAGKYGNVTLTAQWTANVYTITFLPNGGSVNPTSKTFTIESTIDLPTPTKDSYVFDGWLVTTAEGNWTNGTLYTDSSIPAGKYGNVTVTAQWHKTVTVHFYSGSKGAVHNQFQITFKNNETAGSVKSPASFGTIDGWTALGWTASTAASKAVGDAAIKGGTTITVAPAKNEYVYYAVYTQSQALKYESNANGDTSVKNIPANGTLAGAYYNSSDAKLNITRTIPSTVPTRNGYTFKSWNTQANGSGTNYAAGARYTNSAQIDTLYAQWTENQYTITYVNGNGNADSKVGYKITAEITIIAAPTYDGYVFVGWKVTTVTNGNWTSGDLYGAGAKIGSGKYGNVTLVAQWVYVKDAETKADEYNQDNTISIVTGVDGNGNTTSITTTKYDTESFKKYQDAINAYNNAKKSIPTDINASNYSEKLSAATKTLQDAINALVNITLTERGVVTDYLNNFLIDLSGTRHNLNEMNLNHYDLATTVETAKNALVNGNAIKAKSYGITAKDTDGKTFQTKINEYVAAMAKAFKTKTQVKTEGPGFKVYENADAAKAVTDANGKTLAGATAVNYAYAGKGNYTYYCYTNSTNPTVLITVDDIANAGRVCYPTTAKATAAPTLSGSAKNANAAYTITKIPAGNADNDYLTYTKLSIGGASSYYQQKQVITLTPEFTSGTNGTVTYEFTATDDALTPNVATQSALSSGIGDANSWQKNLADDTTNTKKITIVVDYHSGDQMTVTGDQVNRDTYLNQYHLFRQSGGAKNWELPKTGDKVYKVNDTTYGQTDRGSFTFTYELGATDIGNGKINTTDVNEIIKLFKDESNYSAAKKLSFVGTKYWTKNSNGTRVQHEGSGLGYQVWGNNWSFNYYPKSESYTYVHLVDRWGNVVDKVFYVGKQDINEVSVSTASADGTYTILEDGGSGIDTLSLNAGTLEILTDENSTLENNVYRTTGNTVRIKTGEANKSYTLSMKDKATNASTATLESDGNGIITLSIDDAMYKSGVYTFMLNGTEINLYDGVNNDKYILNVYDGEAEEGEAAEMIVITTGEVGKTRFTDTDGNTITVAASETNEDGTKTWRMSKSRPAGEYEYRISVKVGHNWIEENSTGKLIFTEKQLDTGRIVKAEYDEESGLYKLTIEGRATKIQFITEDGMTRTYTRYSEAVKSRKSYDAEGNEVPDTGRLLDHEVWLVNARLYSGQNYTVAGKFEAGWNREGTATLTAH